MHIAILTRLPNYYSEQRLSEEGKKRGHQVSLVQYTKCSIAIDPEHSAVFYRGKPLQDVDAIIPRLGVGSVTYGCAMVRQLEVGGVYTPVSSIGMSRTFDRLRALQLLSRSGVEVPTTVFSREADHWDELLAPFTFPVLIRPVEMGESSDPVQAESTKAAASLMGALSKGAGFMIQQLGGEDSVDMSAMVIGSTVVASIQYQSDKGKKVKAVPAKLSAEEVKMVLKAAKALGLTVCSVQFSRSSTGSKVTSVAATPSLESFEKAAPRRNLAEKIIIYIERNAKRQQKKDRVGA